MVSEQYKEPRGAAWAGQTWGVQADSVAEVLPFPRRARRATQFSGRVFRAAARTLRCLAAERGREGLAALSGQAARLSQSRVGRGEISLARGLARGAAAFTAAGGEVLGALAAGGVPAGFHAAGRIVCRSFAELRARHARLLQCLAPAAGIAVLGMTVYFWGNVTFAYQVSYRGQTLGYVASESDYRQAADKLEKEVQSASGTRFAFESAPAFQMALVKKSDLVSTGLLADRLAGVSDGEVARLYGLYVDNKLVGAVENESDAETVLNGILDTYRTDAVNQQVSFAQTVSIRRGMFPQDVRKTQSQLQTTLTAKGGTAASQTSVDGLSRISLDSLYARSDNGQTSDQAAAQTADSGAALLSVTYVRDETSTQTIPYEVQTVQTDALPKGTQVVQTQGKQGQMTLVSAVTYKDGASVSSTLKSSTVTVAPVAQQVLVGTGSTKKSKSSSGKTAAIRSAAASAAASSGNIVSVAESLVGTRYVSGGSSASGFDCSGFTQYVYAKLGVSLTHSAAGQSQTGSSVSKSNLQTGDLVFFDTNGGKRGVNHVGIYVGGGQFVAANSGGVEVRSLDSGYWSQAYLSARRVQ